MHAFNKTRYIPTLLFFLLIVAMISCNFRKSDETQSLEELMSHFDARIPTEPHIYLLQSSFSCKGCVQKTFSAIDKSLIYDYNNKNKITLIIKQNETIPQRINDNLTTLIDSMNLVDIYFPRLANISIVKTKNGNVDFIKTINIDDLKSSIDLYQYLK